MRKSKDSSDGSTAHGSGVLELRLCGEELEDGSRRPSREAQRNAEPGRKSIATPRSKGPASRSRPRAQRSSQALSAEDLLGRAMRARTPRARGIWARRGLAARSPIERTTQSMLLRQLYLSYFEGRRFRKAEEIATQILELGILPDVAHQDAARAMQAMGDVDGAAGHLRLAARVSPPKRRAFHWWTLGSLYYLAGRHEDAVSALLRAARWGTTDKPLYQGHLAVVRCEAGVKVDDLGGLIERLAEVPAGQGYGRFVLGQMAFHDRRWDEAKRYLDAFVRRTTAGRAALAIALEGELSVARRTLASLSSRLG